MSEPDAAVIRKRPGMYVGDTRDGSGLAHMVWEVVANAVDEHLAGACQQISVEIGADGAVAVEDDGRGFPLELANGASFAEVALTKFHARPTLDGHAPHTHVGKCGVGLFPVCALSERVELHVYRGGRRSKWAATLLQVELHVGSPQAEQLRGSGRQRAAFARARCVSRDAVCASAQTRRSPGTFRRRGSNSLPFTAPLVADATA